MNSQEYLKLKQQAKELLLKGCYKMAYNKYKSLSNNHPQDISSRELSTLLLNQGICQQGLQNYELSLSLIQESIKADPSYEKAYYRKIKVCKQLKKFDQILNIPGHIRNKQIDILMTQVKQQYILFLAECENQQIEQALKKNINDNNIQSLKQVNKSLISKYSEATNNKLKQELEQGIFQKYFQMILNQKNQQILSNFYNTIYIIFKEKENLLNQNWWLKHFQTLFDSTIFKQIHRIINICPYFKLQVKDKLLSDYLKQINTIDSLSTLLVLLNAQDNISSLYKSNQLSCLIDILCDTTYEILQKQQQFQLSWSILMILFKSKYKESIKPQFKKVQNFKQLCILYYSIITSCSENNSQFRQIEFKQIQQLIKNIFDTHFTIPFINILHQLLLRLKYQTSQVSSQIKQKIIQKHNNTNLNIKLLVLLITSKIDYTLLNQKDIMMILNNSIIENPDLILELYGAICMTNRKYLLVLYNNGSIKKLFESIRKDIVRFGKLRLKASLVSVIYLLVVDTTEIKIKQTADKLGVSIQEIAAARKLQNAKQQLSLQQQIKHKRGDFLKTNIEVIKHILQNLLQPSTQLISFKLSSIISSLSKINNKIFYSSSFIDYMITQFKNPHSQLQIFQFFSSICKQCNPQVILFKHKQLIVNILQQSLQKSGHELIIFQSLLGIINLLPQTNIDINIICRLLFQQNQYILHACFNIINNYLVRGKTHFEKISQKTLKTIFVYYRHYKNLIESQQYDNKNTNDYSNPQRIYSTIMSLLMIISEYNDKQEEIEELKSIEQLIKVTKKLDLRERSVIIAKGSLHFANKGKFNKNILLKIKDQILYLKDNDKGMYAQLAKIL